MEKKIVKQTDSAFDRHKQIVCLRNQAVITFLELGRELYWFEHEKQYLDLSHPTFESYLADPYVDISRRLAFMLKGIYKTFILDLEVKPVALVETGYSKLEVIRPHVTHENVDEWINKAAALSRSDLRIEVEEKFSDHKPDIQNQVGTVRQVTLRTEINEVENFKMFLAFLDYQNQGLTRRIFQEIQQGNFPSVEVKITAVDGILNLDEI